MPARVADTPSLTLVESLMGAIPDVVGAALVARIGERATIVTASGTIEAGSIELTVEAIDELIAQVLPPDQLQILQKAGTIQFELTPSPSVAGHFTVLAAAAPGDRWLEIRRKSASAATATSEANAVAQLLARSATVAKKEPAISTGASLDVKRAIEPSSERPAAPVAQTLATDAADAADDDLAVPTNLGFPARSDFARDALTLPDAAPGFLDADGAPTDPERADWDSLSESPGADGSHTRRSSTVLQWARQRRRVLLSVVPIGAVMLFVTGVFAGTRLGSTARAIVARAPALRKQTPIAGAAAPRKAAAATFSAHPVAGPGRATEGSAPQPAPASATASSTPVSSTPVRTVAPVAPVVPPVPAARLDEHPHAGFSIQVAAVREHDQADRMLLRLVSQGYAGYLVRGQGASADFYRVRVGGFSDRKAAEEAAVQLERDEWTKPWILKEDSPASASLAK
jgi:cell division septation protein DedD